MQWPKDPNMTEELRMWVLLVSMTFRMAMSLATGADTLVINSRMEEMRMRTTPTLGCVSMSTHVDVNEVDRCRSTDQCRGEVRAMLTRLFDLLLQLAQL